MYWRSFISQVFRLTLQRYSCFVPFFGLHYAKRATCAARPIRPWRLERHEASWTLTIPHGGASCHEASLLLAMLHTTLYTRMYFPFTWSCSASIIMEVHVSLIVGVLDVSSNCCQRIDWPSNYQQHPCAQHRTIHEAPLLLAPVASSPGPFEKLEERAWYPLFVHALNFNFPTFREFQIIPCYLRVLWR